MNSRIGAETITLLELKEVLNKKGQHISHGKIKVAYDNRQLHKKIIHQTCKPSIFIQDSGVEISRIKQIVNNIPFKVKLTLDKGHKALRTLYWQAPNILSKSVVEM